MISLKWVCDAKPETMAASASEAADIAAAFDHSPDYMVWSQKLIIQKEGAADA